MLRHMEKIKIQISNPNQYHHYNKYQDMDKAQGQRNTQLLLLELKQKKKPRTALKPRKAFKHWSDRETNYFVKFLAQNKYTFYKSSYDGRNRVNKRMYLRMSIYLKQNNIQKDPQQCRSHFNRLVKERQGILGDIQSFIDSKMQQASSIFDLDIQDEKRSTPVTQLQQANIIQGKISSSKQSEQPQSQNEGWDIDMFLEPW